MRDPFDTQPNLVHSSRHSSGEFAQPATAAMQPGAGFTVGNGDAGYWNPSSDSSIRRHLERESDRKARIEENNLAMDPELTELRTRSRSQEEEIVMLHKQIADACEHELQLLKEKHVLERRLSDLRMALDEKQEDAIEDVLKDLSHRKVCIQKNMRLAHDLQVAEEEVYVFTSSLLSLLAEYNIRLPLLNASAITSSTKRLYQNMEWKIRSCDASLDQGQRLLGNQPGDLKPNIDRQPPKFSQIQLSQPHLDSGMRNLHQYNHHPVNLHVESAPDQSRFTGNYDMMDMKGVKAGTNPDLQYREFPSNTYRMY